VKTCSSLLRTAVIAAVIAVLPISPLDAQQSQQKASDAHVTDLMNQALKQVNAGQTAKGTVQQTQGPSVDLRLEDAVGRAMDQNVDLAVARLGPQLQDLSLAGVRAAYRPTLTSRLGDSNSTTTPNTTLGGGSVVTTGTYTYNGAVSQVLPWTGGTASLSWNNNRQTSNSNNVTYNPSYSATWSAQLTQPLWRNFRIDSTRNSLWTGIISRQIADVTLRASVVNTEASTRIAYWNLVYAVQNVAIQETAVGLAEQFVKDNQAKVEVGTLAPLDVIQAQSNLATARQRLVSARQTREQNELTLKRLIVGSTQDPLWTATLNPVDRPEPPAQAGPIDLKAAIANALDRRTDLITARETLHQSDVTLKYNKNQSLPQADLTASYLSNGTGGNLYQRQGGLTGAPVLLREGGYLDALSIVRKLANPTWSFTLNFSYPIGTSSADASYARAKVQYQQSLTQLKSAELRVATDVTQAALNVQSNLQQVETARAARELAQKQLEAEQSKFEVGMQTNYFVVQAQQTLASAQVSELQALLNYRISLVTFDQVQQTGSASVSGVSAGGGGSSGGGGQ
jgi:outer membrane protein TolC